MNFLASLVKLFGEHLKRSSQVKAAVHNFQFHNAKSGILMENRHCELSGRIFNHLSCASNNNFRLKTSGHMRLIHEAPTMFGERTAKTSFHRIALLRADRTGKQNNIFLRPLKTAFSSC